MSVNEKMKAIADAIRGKTGGTEGLTLDQMATEIAGIETGGGGFPLEYEVTEYVHSEDWTTDANGGLASNFVSRYCNSDVFGDTALYVCLIENNTVDSKGGTYFMYQKGYPNVGTTATAAALNTRRKSETVSTNYSASRSYYISMGSIITVIKIIPGVAEL